MNTAKDGVITLTGVVDSYAKKLEAEDAAKNVDGVKAVVEKILVAFGHMGDVDEIQGQQVVEQLKAAGANARFFKADVGDPAQCQQLVKETVSAFGSLDIACNNAGTGGELNMTADYSLAG